MLLLKLTKELENQSNEIQQQLQYDIWGLGINCDTLTINVLMSCLIDNIIFDETLILK